MKPGTIVRLPDGREGTVVFHGLSGYGVKWGRHAVKSSDFDGTVGDLGLLGVHGKEMDIFWQPDAMLREPYAAAALECVGEDYQILADGEGEA
jgi:hypothetical protein